MSQPTIPSEYSVSDLSDAYDEYDGYQESILDSDSIETGEDYIYSQQAGSPVERITVYPKYTDDEMQNMEGEHFDRSEYDTILTHDADIYKPDGSLLLRFRKGVIPKKLTDNAVESFRLVAMKKHDNRGASAGPLDWKKMPNYVGDWVDPYKFRTHYTRANSGIESKHHISNLSPSNIVGYYDKKDRNKPNGPPCRLTAFSAKECEKWDSAIPFIKHVDALFKELVPDRHHLQRQRAGMSPEFVISDTAFSTVTVNYSWRTALHRDKGDFENGFGNLIVCEDHKNPNQYGGCCTGFPQFGVCVDARNGDFIAMDVHEWHCNTEFESKGGSKSFHRFKKKDFENDWYFNRLSVVCYLRNNMAKCSEKMGGNVKVTKRHRKRNTS
jgi:hypothetical protein